MSVTNSSVIRVAARLLHGVSDEHVNVFHVQSDSGNPLLTDTQAQDDILDILEDAYTFLVPVFDIAMDFQDVAFYNVTAAAPMVPRGWPTLTAGTETVTNRLPQQVAALAGFRTLVPNSVGRKFIGGLTEAANDFGGTVGATLATAMANYAAEFLGDIVGTNGTWRFGNYRPLIPLFISWASAYVDETFRSQRRRVRGVGA